MTTPFVSITPLGGLGEIGLNCQMWSTDQGIVLVDCGLMFPDDQQLGIDIVIPPLDPIIRRQNSLLGLVLTHGHEDHIGAIPWLLSFIDGLTLYGSPFTLALVEHKLKERGLMDKATLSVVEPRDTVRLGALEFTFLPVSHSIPQGYALAVNTPVGKIIHTGDFKLDATAPDGVGTDLDDFRAFAGNKGVKLLLSDSTNVEVEGHSQPELKVKEALRKIFSTSQSRIIITLFSSHMERVQSVFDMAREFDRHVVISGRSLTNNIEKAQALGLLVSPPEIYSDQNMPILDPAKTVIIATGSQGEPLSALARISSGEHRQLHIVEGDTVIMSSRAIPGNARAVNRMINQMYRQGALVLHEGVHATGHAMREELRAMLEAVRPEYFVPVHGEFRHLARHRELARECGVAPEKIIVMENGDTLSLLPQGVRQEEKIAVESILVDGKGVGDVGASVLRERQLLGGDGVVVVSVTIDAADGSILHGPELISRGFMFTEHFEHVLEDAKQLVLDQLRTTRPKRWANRVNEYALPCAAISAGLSGATRLCCLC